MPNMPPDSQSLKQQLRSRVREAGMLDARVAAARLSPVHLRRLEEWLDAGMHGEMNYIARDPVRRCDATNLLPGARSVIVVAAAYEPVQTPAISGSGTVRIASYAVGEDYHLVLRERLEPVVAWLGEAMPENRWRICIDSAPLLERAYAEACGIGFFGRNTMLISPKWGSCLFLAEILTTAAIEPDAAVQGKCGNCTRCIDACPTGALAGPFRLDARRCVSYLTIEKRSPLSDEERELSGAWAFGCDECQAVCPYNEFAGPPECAEFWDGRVVHKAEPLVTFEGPQSNSQFARRFARSPLLRPGRKRLLRNARTAASRSQTSPDRAKRKLPE